MHAFPQLVAAFEERFKNTLPFPTAPQTLYDPCRYLLEWGGKRIRPVVCLMAHELFGAITEDAWHAAKALELFHNFTLVHDDIMDKAPLRRGKPTLHEKYGLTAGILSGDVLCIYAYKELERIKLKLPQVLAIFNHTAIEVCEGQQLDMDYEQRTTVSIEEYLHMITLKTSVLLAAGIKIGAILGGATEGNADKLYAFGKNLGLAFQLRDDYLDAFGDETQTGKHVGGDILANKKTYLLLQTLQRSTEAERSQLQYLLQHNEADKVARTKTLMLQTGAANACTEAIQHYSDKAFEALEAAAVMSSRKKHLQDLAMMLLDRKH